MLLATGTKDDDWLPGGSVAVLRLRRKKQLHDQEQRGMLHPHTHSQLAAVVYEQKTRNNRTFILLPNKKYTHSKESSLLLRLAMDEAKLNSRGLSQ
jgi:hypothetical protein